MSARFDSSSSSHAIDTHTAEPAGTAPGKVAMTQRMARAASAPAAAPDHAPAPVQRHVDPLAAAVQRKRLERDLDEALGYLHGPEVEVQRSFVQLKADAHTGLSDAEIGSRAAAGIAGGGRTLPHLDTIQRAFGPHDVSGVRAHVGGAAADASASIGAHAYATGNDVAFAKEPDLFLAAHEAAHVVQQRQGVHLSSAVGQDGDAYERHADDVAAAVVRGDSAAGLLGEVAGGDGTAVQRKGGPKPAADEEIDPNLDPELGTEKEQRLDQALLLDAIDDWETSMIENARAFRDWALANWTKFLKRTAPNSRVSWDKSAFMTFIEGGWGNIYTDAPDTVIEMIFKDGLADMAKDGIKTSIGTATKAMTAAGTIAGGVVGLIVSAAIATAVEMMVDALLDAPDEARVAAAAAAGVSVDQMSDKAQTEIKRSDVAIDQAIDDARDLRAIAPTIQQRSQVTDRIVALRKSASALTAKRRPASDDSMFKALMKDWVIENAKDTRNPKATVTQQESWKAAASDESIMGEGGLDAQTRTGHMSHDLASHQIKSMLRGAGLSYEHIVERVIGERSRDANVAEVTDELLYTRFLKVNWGLERSAAGKYVDVRVKTTSEDAGGVLGQTDVVSSVETMTIAPDKVDGFQHPSRTFRP